MSYQDDDEAWLSSYNIDDFPKDSPPHGGPGMYHDASLDNIPLDDSGASPGRDLHDLQYNNNLAVPMFGNDSLRLSPNSYEMQTMTTMQSTSNYEHNLQPTTPNMIIQQQRVQESYNAFEQPTVVVNGQTALDPFSELDSIDAPVAATYFQTSSPSTSQQSLLAPTSNGSVVQMINTSNQQPQHNMKLQQQMASQAPSTSYVDVSSQQRTSRPPPSRKSSSKPNGRKKPPAADTLGAYLTKAARMASSQHVRSESSPGAKKEETTLTIEDSQKAVKLSMTMEQLKNDQEINGVDHTAEIARIEQEISQIFLISLSKSNSASRETLTQMQQFSETKKSAPSNANRQAQRRNRGSNASAGGIPMQTTSAPVNVAQRFETPDSPGYQPQIVYHTVQPSTSNAAYMEYPTHVVQSGQQPMTQIVSSNARAHVYRGNVMFANAQPAQTQLQQMPQGTIYVQTMQQNGQAGPQQVLQAIEQPQGQTVFASHQQTVGDLVRQQQSQLRFTSTAATSTNNSAPGGNSSYLATTTTSAGSAATRQQIAAPVPHMQLQVPPQGPRRVVSSSGVGVHSSNASGGVAAPAQLLDGGSTQMFAGNSQSGPTFVHVMNAPRPAQASTSATTPNTRIRPQSVRLPPPLPVVQPAAPLPRPQVVIIRPNAEEVKQAMRAKTNERQRSLKAYFEQSATHLLHPETERPFESEQDVLQRLLPYSLHLEPDLKQSQLDDFDGNWMRTNINFDQKMKNFSKRMSKIMLSESMQSVIEKPECNLLLSLEVEYEKRKMETDKAAARESLEGFVASSEIIPLIKQGILTSPDKVPLQLKPPTNALSRAAQQMLNQFEYHPFDDAPPPSLICVPFSPVASSLCSPSSTTTSFRSRQSSLSSSATQPLAASCTEESKSNAMRSTGWDSSVARLHSHGTPSRSTIPPAAASPKPKAAPVETLSAVTKQLLRPSSVSVEKKEDVPKAAVVPVKRPVERSDVTPILRAQPLSNAPIREKTITKPLRSSSAAVFPIRSSASSMGDADSDGSASPELGIDDDVSAKEVVPTTVNPTPKPATPDLTRSILKIKPLKSESNPARASPAAKLNVRISEPRTQDISLRVRSPSIKLEPGSPVESKPVKPNKNAKKMEEKPVAAESKPAVDEWKKEVLRIKVGKDTFAIPFEMPKDLQQFANTPLASRKRKHEENLKNCNGEFVNGAPEPVSFCFAPINICTFSTVSLLSAPGATKVRLNFYPQRRSTEAHKKTPRAKKAPKIVKAVKHKTKESSIRPSSLPILKIILPKQPEAEKPADSPKNTQHKDTERTKERQNGEQMPQIKVLPRKTEEEERCQQAANDEPSPPKQPRIKLKIRFGKDPETATTTVVETEEPPPGQLLRRTPVPANNRHVKLEVDTDDDAKSTLSMTSSKIRNKPDVPSSSKVKEERQKPEAPIPRTSERTTTPQRKTPKDTHWLAEENTPPKKSVASAVVLIPIEAKREPIQLKPTLLAEFTASLLSKPIKSTPTSSAEPKLEPPPEQPSSPPIRSTSSMSFLLDDERSNGTINFPFLKSPPPMNKEPLPVVEFSDDEMDQVHNELGKATDYIRGMAMSTEGSSKSSQ